MEGRPVDGGAEPWLTGNTLGHAFVGRNVSSKNSLTHLNGTKIDNVRIEALADWQRMSGEGI